MFVINDFVRKKLFGKFLFGKKYFLWNKIKKYFLGLLESEHLTKVLISTYSQKTVPAIGIYSIKVNAK